MSKKSIPDVLVLGAGPAGMAIASALGKEKLDVEVLSPNGPDEPWPNTYGIWGEEVDQLGLQDLLEYRWKNTVSFFGHGALEEQDDENKATEHSLDYGLFDIYRELQPDDHSFSWWDYRGGAFHKNEGLRIDFLLSTSSNLKKIQKVIIDREYRKKRVDLIPSDHAPVWIELND